MADLSDIVTRLRQSSERLPDYPGLAARLVLFHEDTFDELLVYMQQLVANQTWQVTEKRIDALDIAASELEDTVPSVAATLRAMVAETE